MKSCPFCLKELPKLPRGASKRKVSDEQIISMKADRLAGMSVKELAFKYEVSLPTVSRLAGKRRYWQPEKTTPPSG